MNVPPVIPATPPPPYAVLAAPFTVLRSLDNSGLVA
jgi:hypothetical protein